MAVPTISSISPTIGHTGGRQLVEILGTNFRTPTPQTNPTGPLPVAPTPVEVEIGGASCFGIAVIDSTRILARTGVRDEGTDLDVVVRNVDDSGVPIAGEEATLSGAYSYRLPQLSTPSALLNLIRSIIVDMRRQIHPEVHLSVHTDFDDTVGDFLSIAKVASTPALAIAGPSLEENRFYSLNQLCNVDIGGDEFITEREKVTVDVFFDVMGISTLKKEQINLMNAAIAYFRKNKNIAHPVSGELLEFEWESGGMPKLVPRPGDDNLRLFRGSFLVRGVDIGEFPGFARDLVVSGGKRLIDADDFFELQPTTNLGQTFPVGTLTFHPPRTGIPFPPFPVGGS